MLGRLRTNAGQETLLKRELSQKGLTCLLHCLFHCGQRGSLSAQRLVHDRYFRPDAQQVVDNRDVVSVHADTAFRERLAD